MGPIQRAVITDRCPWSLVYKDRVATTSLSAFGLIERWREWPPGPRDPRLMAALTVIAAEHNRINDELLPRK